MDPPYAGLLPLRLSVNCCSGGSRFTNRPDAGNRRVGRTIFSIFNNQNQGYQGNLCTRFAAKFCRPSALHMLSLM